MTSSGERTDTVLIIQQQDESGFGWLADAFDDAHVPFEVVQPNGGRPLPDTVRWRGIIPLGGDMGAYETDTYPFLRDEMAFLRRAVSAATPVLAICLGCQLLAHALGGQARPAPSTRFGVPILELTSAGETDPVLGPTGGGPFFFWHSDTFDPPPEAELLATYRSLPYAYRIGSALAVQFHPEASPDLVDIWIQSADEDKLEDTQVDTDRIRQEVRDTANARRHAGTSLFRAWIDRTAQAQRSC